MSSMPDPNTATREEFTQFELSKTCPANATPKYRKLLTDLQRLLDLLAHHEAMRPNLNQTYITPAASKNKAYFMWDFVGRTLAMLHNVDPRLPRSAMDDFDEAQGRAMFGCVLINDTTGKLDMMAGGSENANVDFGDEIRRLASSLS